MANIGYGMTWLVLVLALLMGAFSLALQLLSVVAAGVDGKGFALPSRSLLEHGGLLLTLLGFATGSMNLATAGVLVMILSEWAADRRTAALPLFVEAGLLALGALASAGLALFYLLVWL